MLDTHGIDGSIDIYIYYFWYFSNLTQHSVRLAASGAPEPAGRYRPAAQLMSNLILQACLVL